MDAVDGATTIPVGAAPGAEQVAIVLDSCNSVWHFQPGRMRFRRALKGLGGPYVSTGWRPYYGLRLDDGDDGFVVLLNPQGTRLLRSWRHRPGQDHCESCRADRTQELSLDAIRSLAG